MATFKVVPDTRYKRKDNTHRYCLRTVVEGKVTYLPLDFKLTPQEHKIVFNKKSMGKTSIDVMEQINEIETKAKRIYSSMKRFDSVRFKQLFLTLAENM